MSTHAFRSKLQAMSHDDLVAQHIEMTEMYLSEKTLREKLERQYKQQAEMLNEVCGRHERAKAAIEAALRVRDLWAPPEDPFNVSRGFESECIELANMERGLREALDGGEG